MKRLVLSSLAFFGAALPAFAAGAPGEAAKNATATVATIPARQGSLPERIRAWGSAMPGSDAASVLAIQTAGQVTRWQVMAGERVQRGQTLLEFSAAPAAVASYAQASTALDLAREQRARTARLLAQQLATRDQLAQADKAVTDAQATLAALRRQQGDRTAVTLKAPFDGVVATTTANQGDTLAAGAPLLTLNRADGLVVAVGVEPSVHARLAPGAAVRLTPLDGGESIDGSLQRIGAALNPKTRLVDAQIATAAPLLSGAAYRADITVGQWHGWLVPRHAVRGDEGDRHVFQVVGGKAVEVPVEVVGESEDTSVVDGKLDAGAPIVTTGATQLEDGMAVREGAAEAKP